MHKQTVIRQLTADAEKAAKDLQAALAVEARPALLEEVKNALRPAVEQEVREEMKTDAEFRKRLEPLVEAELVNEMKSDPDARKRAREIAEAEMVRVETAKMIRDDVNACRAVGFKAPLLSPVELSGMVQNAFRSKNK